MFPKPNVGLRKELQADEVTPTENHPEAREVGAGVQPVKADIASKESQV